jgi:hypothetical protein
MKRLLGSLIACVAIVLIPLAANALIVSITVTPPSPTQQDPVSIEVAGWFPDSCWSLVSTSCDSLRGQDIYLNLRGLDIYVAGLFCYFEVVPYRFSCDYPPLAAGDYTVHVTEYHESLRDPGPRTLEGTFEVRQSVPVLQTSWGCLRVMYR